MTLAEMFAALPEETQVTMVKTYVGNQLFKLAAQAVEELTPDQEMELLVQLVEIESGHMVNALPEKERLETLETCAMARRLISERDEEDDVSDS